MREQVTYGHVPFYWFGVNASSRPVKGFALWRLMCDNALIGECREVLSYRFIEHQFTLFVEQHDGG